MNKNLVFLLTIGITIISVPSMAREKLQSCKVAKAQSFNTDQQSMTITGTISDNNGTLAGVSVAVKGKPTATITDSQGKYSIEADPTDVLVFTFMGYKTVEIDVNGQSAIDLSMQEDVTALREVTVNAGYYTVKDKERTGSISKITSKDIEKQPVTNVLAAMQGRMAGVNITQTTGVPGGAFQIQIRGQNSLRANANNPLFIIDGVPYSTEALDIGSSSNVTPTDASPLNSINPDQIESIEVLKDADATAIYGSRGANGVVLVTTKKAKAGKTQFTGRISKGYGSVPHFVKMMNTEQYLSMRAEAFANDGITTYPASAYDINGTWDATRHVDWQKELLGGTAEITDVHAAVSGGSAQTNYLFSTNYNKQTTVFPGDFNYKKANFYLNAGHESEDKKFRSNFSVSYTVQDNDQPATDLSIDALRLSPNAPELYDEEGNLNWENNTFSNPLRKLNGKFLAKTYDLLASAVLSYKILPNLELKSNFGYTATELSESNSSPNTIYNPAFGFGPEYTSIIFTGSDRKSWIAEPQINWKKSFGKSKLDVLVGSTFQSQQSNLLAQYAEGFSSVALIYDLASASDVFTLGSNETVYKYQAFFGRVNYNVLDRYIFNLTGRRDGSSRFGPGKQFANFGAIGAAWLFSEEALLKDNSILSFGKLRANYGITGNDQIGDYQYLNTYSSTGVDYGGTIGLSPTQLFNRNFGWETNKKFEVGLETGFFKDRIFLTAGYYSNRSSNQLVGTPLPGTTGFPSVQANLNATVENKGVELSLRTVNVQGKDFSWSTNFNITFSKNELLSFPDLESSTYQNTYIVGQPLNIQRLFHYTGVDPATGVYTFEDVNGDGELRSADDKKTIADFNPEYYGGIQNQLKYKRWQLDFLFQFVKQINYNSTLLTAVPGNRSNQPAEVVNHWQAPGDNATHQIYTSGNNDAAVEAFFQYIESDGAVTDASYIRLKNIALSWDVPEELLKKVRCKISLQAQNLLTFTKYKGSDPEFTSSGYLPPLRIITAGLQISF